MKILRIIVLLLISASAIAAPRRILDSISPNTKMAAAVMQSGKVVHLWLSASNPNDLYLVAAYSRVTPPTGSQIMMLLEKDLVPIATEFASPTALIENVKPKELSLEWSPDGTAVSLLHKGVPQAFVVFGEKYGYSKAIAKYFEFGGSPWDEDKYQKIFHPSERDILLGKAIALHDKRDFDGALKIYEQMLATSPDDAGVLYEAGNSSMSLGKHDACIAYATRGAALPSKLQSSLYALLGSCLDNSGQMQKAVAAFQEGLKLDPRNVTLNLNAGVTFAKANEHQKARDSLRMAIEVQPSYATPYFVYGQLLDKEGHAGSVALYLRYLMINISSPRSREVATRIVELLKSAARFKDGKVEVKLALPSIADEADNASTAIISLPLGLAGSSYTVAQQAQKGNEAERVVEALTLFVSLLKPQTPEVSDSFLGKAALSPLDKLNGNEALQPFLFTVAALADVAGGKEWVQGHRKEFSAMVETFNSLKLGK